MNQLSPERQKFNQVIEDFKARMRPGVLIYDIGKSHLHDYKETFSDFRYMTLDCDAAKKPDILVNLEIPEEYVRLKPADAVIMHGVYEQCQNPFNVLKGLNFILKKGGLALFGLISVGYPIFENDHYRITPKGSERYLKGFEILKMEIVERSGIPSYIFVTAEKSK